MVTNQTDLKNIPQLQQVKRIAPKPCKRCRTGKLFHEGDEDVCFACGYTESAPTLPKVDGHYIHGETK